MGQPVNDNLKEATKTIEYHRIEIKQDNEERYIPLKQEDSTTTTTYNYHPSTPSYSQGSNFEVTFYDPAVLGASTMPGGLYSGVAANLSIYPKGTNLKITLQDGTVMYRTVNDTGTFAYSNPYQLDIACPNNQIPSYGRGTATVEVI